MPARSEPDIRHTALEKVLIRHQAMKANRYQKVLFTQARKQAKEYCQRAQHEAQEIRRQAYQQGYQDGIQQLLTDLIYTLELSQRQYQQAWQQSHTQLNTLLIALFSDQRLQEIVTDYFIKTPPDPQGVQLHLPASLLAKLKSTLPATQHIKLLAGSEESIALAVGNEIIDFSPGRAAYHTLPQILSLPARCTAITERLNAYRQLVTLANQQREHDDNLLSAPHTESRPDDTDLDSLSQQ